MIVLDRVSRRWGRFMLQVSLRVAPREYMVLLGPSGSGKSLLLGLLAGIDQPELGRIELDGRDVTHGPPEARGIGMVFQRFSLFPHLTVAGNIEFGLRARRVPRAQRRQRLDELVGVLDLAQVLDRPVATLSGGESQKVALARALAPRPAVLLLDEPLSLVDHNTRLELRAELARLHRELSLTTVHVTHDREEAGALADRCAVMMGGRIIQSGTLDELHQRPSCLFVDRFVGARRRPPPEPPGCSEACLAGSGRCDRPAGALPTATDAPPAPLTTAAGPDDGRSSAA